MVNKLVVDNLNITLNESTVLPFTYTFSMSGVHDVRIGLDNTNEICAYAFKDCEDLSKVKHIPDKITMIKRNAFENCVKLKDFYMPAHIEYVGPNVFDGCTSLKEITFESPEPPRFFTNLLDITDCYIPDNSKYVPVEKEDIVTDGSVKYYKKLDNFGGYGFEEVDFETLDLSDEGPQYYIDNWTSVHNHYNTIEERFRVKPTSIDFLNEGIPTTTFMTLDEDNYSGRIDYDIRILPENATNSNVYLFSGNPNVLTVNQSGEFEVINPPRRRQNIRVYACTEPYYDNTYCATSLMFTIMPPAEIKPAVDLTNEEFNYDIPEITVTSEPGITFPTLTNTNNVRVTYSSSNTNVATVNRNGIVTIIGNGTTTISASFEGNEYYNPKTVEYILNVNIEEETISYDLEIEYESENGNIQIINIGESQIQHDLEIEYESENGNIQIINED